MLHGAPNYYKPCHAGLLLSTLLLEQAPHTGRRSSGPDVYTTLEPLRVCPSSSTQHHVLKHGSRHLHRARQTQNVLSLVYKPGTLVLSRYITYVNVGVQDIYFMLLVYLPDIVRNIVVL